MNLLDYRRTGIARAYDAVTEHGNLFSSVIFHDHARARGAVQPAIELARRRLQFPGRELQGA